MENPESPGSPGSPMSVASSGGGRRRRKKRSLNVEDLFTSVSTAKAFGECPPPPRYVLTPRSAEACLREGVDPEHLRIRDLDSFWEPGLDAARQGMRHEAYSERRHTFMKSLRRARTTSSSVHASEEHGFQLRRSTGCGTGGTGGGRL